MTLGRKRTGKKFPINKYGNVQCYIKGRYVTVSECLKCQNIMEIKLDLSRIEIEILHETQLISGKIMDSYILCSNRR